MSLYRTITTPQLLSGRSARCHACLTLDWLDDNDPDSAADVQADIASSRPATHVARDLTSLAYHVGLNLRVGGGSIREHRLTHKENPAA